MQYGRFEHLISQARLANYLLVCGRSSRKAMQLYRANIRLSQEFQALLSLLEVVLRNRIDAHYKSQFPTLASGEEWLLQAILPRGIFTAKQCRNTLTTIVSTYAGLETNYSHNKNKLIAAFSFGFWKYLFSGHQFAAGGNTLLAIFPARPANTSQKAIFKKLDRISSLRNRVAHHEPICFDATKTRIATNYARDHYQDIIELTTWMGIPSNFFTALIKCLKSVITWTAFNAF